MICRTSFISIISILLLVTVLQPASFSETIVKKNSAETINKVDVNLSVKVDKNSAIATIMFNNNTDKTIYIDKVNGCLNGIKNDVFKIHSGSTEIPYIGKLYKRRASGFGNVIKLLPNQTISTTVVLNKAYGFLPGHHTYTVSYEAFHQIHSSGSPDLLKLKSNIVTFDYHAKK